MDEATDLAMSIFKSRGMSEDEMWYKVDEIAEAFGGVTSIDQITEILARYDIQYPPKENNGNGNEESPEDKLDAAREIAAESIMALDLDEETKNEYLHKAGNAKTVEEAEAAAKEAADLAKKIKEDKEKEAALKKAREEAAKNIKELGLESSVEEEYLAQLANIDSPDQAEEIVNDAAEAKKKADDEKKAEEELNKAREDAAKKIKELGLDKDTEEEYLAQLANIETPEQAEEIVNDAAKAKKDAEEEAKLAKPRKEAKEKIDELTLDESQKDEFKKQVDEADSVDVIEEVLAEANKAAEEKEKNDKLAKQRQEAKEKVKALNLDEETEIEFLDQLDKADSLEAIEAVLSEANKAAEDKEKEEKEKDKKLEDAKKSAIEELKKAGITSDFYFDMINKANTVEGVEALKEEILKAHKASNPVEVEEPGKVIPWTPLIPADPIPVPTPETRPGMTDGIIIGGDDTIVKPEDDKVEEKENEKAPAKDDESKKEKDSKEVEEKENKEKEEKPKEEAKPGKKKGNNPKTGVASVSAVAGTLAISMAGIVAARKKND